MPNVSSVVFVSGHVLSISSRQNDSHYLVLVGGRRGRHPRIGRELLTLENEELVIYVIEKIVNWVYRRAWSGRLLSEQLDDIQFEKFRQEILHEIAEKKGKTDSLASPKSV